ncbi:MULTISPECIES: MotA/TolQ/ExbB proton channel family protein [Salegentibacter]|jgi:biopolymer transport protein ExbB|uniref:Biopolymer transporter ExbB n=4 Tax=Salegentibacter TaxID=143222 RepID=A0A0Q9ZGI0_9FLAO|nr:MULTISPECIES: MotA/TolQ/ExbB proton channel family protein [Salegentibacter]HKL36239.1 MotA/TolQ/ExbB proton channel family protein [Salegentibacter sp.]KRG28478.1 biopolymer transporter ExbB [Salegentibacter mishustinae]OEY73565.1 biopolymer transporter ExbB [Salegentibacter salarius]PKD20601.1 biopolymer transporter ExbB [Salegentibacter salarius]PNW22412.1 biopolymer transporter ExbB [Salegentibacter mishustinae]|tara:strand:- start:200 stop:901 length:702 start_codon:yes stop_codon:yes gene_type:complete
MLYFFQQDGVAEAAQEAEPVVEEKTLSLFDLMLSGGLGGQIIILILFILLFAAVYIYFERLFAIKSASQVDKNFMLQIKDNVLNGNIESAKMRCAQSDSPVARLTEKGISRIGSPLEDINTAIENAGRLEVYKLEKNVSILATIAGAAPMIGFLGTVIGMVIAFHELATSSGQAQMGALAEGIYTAMTTTVAGLIVGIIAYIGYNHLVVKTDKVVHQMEATAVDFLDLLNEPA